MVNTETLSSHDKAEQAPDSSGPKKTSLEASPLPQETFGLSKMENPDTVNKNELQETAEKTTEIKRPGVEKVSLLIENKADVESAVHTTSKSTSKANGSPPESAPKKESSDSAKHVTFIDPEGIPWLLPYNHSRSWSLVIKGHLLRLYNEVFEEALTSSRSYTIKLIKPRSARVLADHWEDLVTPGLEFTVNIQDDDDVRLENTSIPATGASDQVSQIENGIDIIYKAVFLKKSSSGDYEVIATKSSKENFLLDQIKDIDNFKDVKSILEEKREVSRSEKSSFDNTEADSTDFIGAPQLYIRSPVLLTALKAIISFQSKPEETTLYRNISYKSTGTIMTDIEKGLYLYPFADLYHYKDQLLEYKKDINNPSRLRHDPEYNDICDRHIDVLIQYLYSYPTIGLEEAERLWNEPIPKTTFNFLWLLLKPGSDVYVQEGGKLNAYVVEYFEGGMPWNSRDGRATPYQVLVWNLDFNGRFLSRSVREVKIPIFDGERDIRSLPLYPTRFAEDQDLYTKLVKRGERFVQILRKPTLQECTGPSTLQGIRMWNRARVVVDHTCQPWKLKELKQHNLRIPNNTDIVKEEAYHLTHIKVVFDLRTRTPRCLCKVCDSAESRQSTPITGKFAKYDNVDLRLSKFISDHQYFLCFSHVYAFVLKDRVWDLLDVLTLEDPKMDKSIIDTLVMVPESNKRMIKTICEIFGGSYEYSPFTSDYINGKGEGQILLLHGPPGTGKTLTAESVAEYTRRPLLSITAADLGHEPGELEYRLLRFFRDANRWNAIVLLDEADVYLESRSNTDLRRNSIVSVFLRALEYFQGILFLTTNRVGSFDEALMSRIHVQIGYDPLEDSSREKIWENHFRKLEENHKNGGQQIMCTYLAKEFVQMSPELKKLKWNGREIRNAFQTAVALACFDAQEKGEPIPKLTDSNLRQVVLMSLNFKTYIHSTLGQKDLSRIAFHKKLRDDEQTATGIGKQHSRLES